MKKLFCVVVTDVEYMIGLDSPIIFHMRCDDPLNKVEEAVKERLKEEYGYDPQDIEVLHIFSFEVTDLDIIEL